MQDPSPSPPVACAGSSTASAAESSTDSSGVPRVRTFVVLLRFFVVAWLLNLLLLSRCVAATVHRSPDALLFLIAAGVEFGLIYLLPALLPTLLIACWSRSIAFGWAVVMTFAVHFALLVDGIVFAIFRRHLDGFVWNLIWTPGGLASMDTSTSTVVTAVAAAVVLLAISCLVLHTAIHRERPWRFLVSSRPKRAWLWFSAAFVLIAGGEHLTFGIADFTSYRPISTAHDALPFYLRVRFRSLAEACGYERRVEDVPQLRGSEGSVEYPLAPLTLDPARRKLNVVWLVSESLRADALDEEVMPATWKFAHQAQWFRHHYSAGNGTRMGVFGMFYGLYGSYWFSFLSELRSPVVIDRVIDDGYRMFVATSAKFSFPEFDKTIWSRVPRSELLEGNGDEPGWQRDRQLVDQLLQHIDATPAGQPFFTFLFFESPHAQYRFPDSAVVRRPYNEELNYVLAADATPEQIGLVKNRYLNAVHHLDQQLERVITHLTERGLLDSTIVLITGDHGEEFWEKGRYGHHSDFSEEQTRVPMVLWIPGQPAREVDDLTSHLDLAPTILAQLGVTNPPADYSLGHDLLDGTKRDHVVIADWDHLCVRDAHYKGIFAINQKGFLGFEVTTIDDAPVTDEDAYLKQAHGLLAQIMKGQGRFLR